MKKQIQYTKITLVHFLLLILVFTLSIHATTNAISIKNIGLVPYSSYEVLIAQGFKPRKDVESWQFSMPIAWNADPFKDENWRFQLQAWRLIDPILNLL